MNLTLVILSGFVLMITFLRLLDITSEHDMQHSSNITSAVYLFYAALITVWTALSYEILF